MYILKNAIISIIRNIGRNLLIGIIVVVISCAATITLAIRSSANNLIESYENQYDVTATIGIDRESMRGEMKMDRDTPPEDRESRMNNMNDIFSQVNNLTASDIENFGDSKYVKDYYYTLSVGVNSDSIEKASLESSDSFTGGFGGRGGKENFRNIESSDFTLIGYSSISAIEEFINGKYKITSGEVSTDLEGLNCVINSELASLNGIEVGNDIIFVDPSNEENTIILNVTGIYEEDSDTDNAMGMFTTSANTIITNITTVNNLKSNNEDMKVSLTPTFVLNSKDVVEDFKSELYEKGLSEYLSLNTNLDQVEGATSTISNVKTFATTFLVITLLIGGIVLFTINMINIRERKYEIGVLRTIGMKKSFLTMQFMSEILIVSFIALSLGAGIGAISSVNVSNKLLENEISSSREQMENINNNFGGNKDFANDRGMGKINGVADIQAFDSIDAVVDLKVLVQLFGIGLLLVIVSSISSMISIQKFSPLAILKERG